MNEQLSLFAINAKPRVPVRPLDEIVDLDADEALSVQRELITFLTVPSAAGEPWVDWSDIHDFFCSRFWGGCDWHIGRFQGGRIDLPISALTFKDRVMQPLLHSGCIAERRRYYAASDPRDPDYAGWQPQFALSEAQRP